MNHVGPFWNHVEPLSVPNMIRNYTLGLSDPRNPNLTSELLRTIKNDAKLKNLVIFSLASPLPDSLSKMEFIHVEPTSNFEFGAKPPSLFGVILPAYRPGFMEASGEGEGGP